MVEVGLVFWVKAVRLLRHFGILPEIWFKARSKSWRFLRWHRCEGMLPNKWLDRRKKIIKFGWLLPNHIGICPDKLLCPRLINFNFVQFFNDEGISTLKLLLLKYCFNCCSSILGFSPKNYCFPIWEFSILQDASNNQEALLIINYWRDLKRTKLHFRLHIEIGLALKTYSRKDSNVSL